MTEKKKRKATEVLLQMESKLNEMHGLLRNQDHMIKLLSQKVSVLTKQLETQPSQTPSVFLPSEKPQPQQKPLMPGLKPGVVLGQGGLKQVEVKQEQEQEQEELDFPVAEFAPQGKRRAGRYVLDPSKAVPVQQSVLYPDGKNVCLANVEIFQGDKLVKKERTNASGKWITSLKPGTYTVCVFKQSVANKPEVNLSFDIDVYPNNGPIELPKQQV